MINNVQTVNQEKEWYKQFWPWFLIFLPGSVVVASIITIVIAVQSADSLVVDDYYKEAMNINRDLSKIEYAKKIGLSGSLLIKGNKLQLEVNVQKNTIKLAPTLMLKFVHPAHANKDFSITLVQLSGAPLTQAVVAQGDGTKEYYVSQKLHSEKIKLLSQVKWYVRLLPLDKNWQLKGKIKNSNKTISLYAE